MLEGIEALAEFLVSEARTMERGTDSAKRQAKEELQKRKAGKEGVAEVAVSEKV